MSDVTTILKLRNELEILCNAHDQIRTFKYGEFLDIIEEDDIEYLLAHLNIRLGTKNLKSTVFQMEFSVMDRTIEGNENINYVESNTMQVLQDIYNIMSYSPRWQDMGVITTPSTPQKFRHKGADVVTGWTHVIQFEYYEMDAGYCDVPVTGYDYNNGSGGGPVMGTATYKNSNGSFLQSIEVDTIFIAPDIEVTDSDGSTFDQPANEDVICTIANDIFLKGIWVSDLADMPQLTIDADNAGTYTSITDDGSSGTITISKNGGLYAAFSSPLVLVTTDTLDVRRTTTTTAGFFKLTGTF